MGFLQKIHSNVWGYRPEFETSIQRRYRPIRRNFRTDEAQKLVRIRHPIGCRGLERISLLVLAFSDEIDWKEIPIKSMGLVMGSNSSSVRELEQ